MTSDPPLRSGIHPQSHPKAATKSSSTPTALLTPSNPLSSSQTLYRPRMLKNPSRDEQVSATSDKATVALIRRVLCPQAGTTGGASTPQSLEELLPPLTSSNDVDLQLYAILAIIIKEFVFSWYSKFTSDQTLANEVIQVIAHCTRALEQRLRGTDVAQLILDEIPALLEAHITSYRLARKESSMSGLSPCTREIYHALNPHPSLSPVPHSSDLQTIALQRENEAIYRQLLVQAMLTVLLPTEDLENVCLRTVVGDILADLIVGNEVSGRVCEEWFLWEIVTKVLNVARQGDAREDNMEATQKQPQIRLQESGLLSKQEGSQNSHSWSKTQAWVSIWIWRVLQYIYLAYMALRFITTGLFRIASTPQVLSSSTSTTPISQENEKPTSLGGIPIRRPVLDYRLYSMLSQLLDIPQRMPWLGGLLALLQYLTVAGPGRLGDTGSVLDRFLHEIIQDYVLTPTLLPNLLLASRAALFPSNTLPSQVADVDRTRGSASHQSVHSPMPLIEEAPAGDGTATSNANSVSVAAPPLSHDKGFSPLQIASIKRRCAVSILSLVPRPVARTFFGIPANINGPTTADSPDCHDGSTEDVQQHQSSRTSSPDSATNGDKEEELLLTAIEDDFLDLFADEYCNKHLIYSIIETVLVKLLPELSERSITELMEDRGLSLAATPITKPVEIKTN